MSEEFDNSNQVPSVFWPLLILLIGFLIWIGYQDFAVNAQRVVLRNELEAATPVFNAAQNWQGRYNAMMKDLIDSRSKSTNIDAIANQAIQAGIQSGLIRIQQNSTNAATATPPAAASGSSSTPAPSK